MPARKRTDKTVLPTRNGASATAERTKTIHSMLPMNDGASADNRAAVVEILNRQLADHYVLLTKTKFYHWNIEGPEFHDLHELLDEHYAVLADEVDLIAEQSLKLGGQAAGTLAYFKQHSRIKEDPGDTIPDTRRMIQNLLDGHEAIMTALHDDISTVEEEHDDKVTANFLQDVSAEHHKMAWMLRMLLQHSTLETQ
jgi:starvation-inducible DNA-binding protein